ncbi:MAG TPA: dipeptidase [Gammaproteobacteria bacterium]|nr:dipeptidase [Gammaproteobacteria bacterium]
MTRLAARLPTLLLAAALAACGGGGSDSPGRAAPPSAAPPADASTAAARTHPFTLDTHVDIPLDFATPKVDPLDANLQVNLERMRRGGLDAAFFIVYVPQSARTADGYDKARDDALTKFAAIHRMTDELYPNLIELAYTPADVARIAAAGKLVAAIGIENGFVFGKDLALLDRYHELGARYVTLVHDGDNDLARSARPEPRLGDATDSTAGVTELGAAAIERMNRLGIMVDVSHGAKQTALDAMRLSRAPVIASHSGVAGVTKHPRNMDDETLLALRDDGGVIQVVAYDAYLRPQPDEELTATRELRERVLAGRSFEQLTPEQRAEYDAGLAEIRKRWPQASVRQLVDHIDYAVRLIGVDHVGISSDFGGGGGVVGWNDASETANVTAELRARGYGDEDIAKLWSGNLLRVWREVERVAAELAATR